MSFGKCDLNAGRYLELGLYFNNGGKRDKPYRQDDLPAFWGVFVDEIVPFDGFTVWFYHGYPIAMFDHEKHEYTLGNAGYQTATTKARLNVLTGVRISQKGGVWYNNGEPFVDHSDEIYDRIGRSSRVKIDGWRGYSRPMFAVEEVSDTGTWSDSPCPSSKAEEKVKETIATLKSRKVKAYEAFGTTSNVFCMKRYVIVRGIDYAKAVEILKE